MTYLSFIAGLILLILGAELLVRGASRLAAVMGVSPLVIGLTIVAFGTGSPELAVGIESIALGEGNIAIGNIVGSNIFNILFVLGLSAIITPLVVSQSLVRLEIPLMIAVSVLLLLLARDHSLGRADGALLLLCLILYTGFLVYKSRQQNRKTSSVSDARHARHDAAVRRWLANAGYLAAGLGLLVIGSRWLVPGAVAIAQSIGVSELVIGLTVVAVGTSLPEVVTSVVASIRHEKDIAVGNIVGSNLINLLGVLGIISFYAPGGIEIPAAVISFDLPLMIVVAFACLPVFFTDGMVSRWEGAVLFGYYLVYTLYLILAAGQHDVLPVFSAVLLYFAIPLTMITLCVLAIQAMRSRRRMRSGH